MFKQKKLSSGARLGIGLASALLCFALFVSVAFTGVVATVREVVSEKNVKNFVNELLLPSKDSDDPSGLAAELTEQAVDTYYDQLEEELGEDLPFENKEEFKELLEESTASEYIADKVSGLITDYFTGEVTTKFDADEVLELIEDNEELIEEITGEPLPEDIKQTIADTFEDNEIVNKVEKKGLAGLMEFSEEDSFDLPDWIPVIGELDLQDVLDGFRDFVSDENLTLGIVISVALALLIVLINIRQLPKGLRRVSYPVLMAGLPVILNILAESDLDIWEEPILGTVRSMLRMTTSINVTIFAIGAVLLIGGIVLGIVFRAKKVADRIAPAAPAPTPAPAAGPAGNYHYAPQAAPAAPVVPVVPVAPVEEAQMPVAEEAPAREIFTEEAAAEPMAEEAPAVEAVSGEEAAPVAE